MSPQLEKNNRAIAEQKGLTFDLLSDPGNRIARKFGLVFTLPDELNALYLKFGIDVAKTNGDNSLTLPLPARYIIDPDGVIRYAETDPDYTVRPDPEHTISALKSIFGGG